ncbi:MAG: hypothetical protein AAF340_08745 [Pseudomonadota bacterium]
MRKRIGFACLFFGLLVATLICVEIALRKQSIARFSEKSKEVFFGSNLSEDLQTKFGEPSRRITTWDVNALRPEGVPMVFSALDQLDLRISLFDADIRTPIWVFASRTRGARGPDEYLKYHLESCSAEGCVFDEDRVVKIDRAEYLSVIVGPEFRDKPYIQEYFQDTWLTYSYTATVRVNFSGDCSPVSLQLVALDHPRTSFDTARRRFVGIKSPYRMTFLMYNRNLILKGF